MDCPHSTMSERKKGKHLTFENRCYIQIRLKDGYSIRAIAREIGCSPSTVANEIARGTVVLYNGHVERYKAITGQMVYDQHHANSCRHYDALEKASFLRYVEKHFFADHWSLDACVGRAIAERIFSKDEVVCTRTLYHYVDLGILEIKNHHLPEKLRRKPKKQRVRQNKKRIGRSIEERSPEIETREEFGHWECDLVLGAKTRDDEVLLTLAERKSRDFFLIPLADKTSASGMKAFDMLRDTYSEHFSEVFKTITTDNGSEFADLSSLEHLSDTLVYFAHPYTSCDKGTIERHNGLIRRFIPKGKRIDSYSLQQIADIETWCNCLPRKILGYRTPDEVFEHELDKIYQASA